MRVSVHLITWNGLQYVPYLFASLRKQTYTDFFLLIIDNGSTDGMVEAMKKELNSVPFFWKLIAETKNSGFAPAHNRAVEYTGTSRRDGKTDTTQEASEFFLLLNQDVCIEPEYIERCVQFLHRHPDVGAVQGRLMRWDFEMVKKTGDARLGKTNQIDTLGLKIFRSRRMVDWFTGESWHAVSAYFKEPTTEVFGVSGALPLFRRSAIEAVSSGGILFDEEFFSYKEDVDLAYRLRGRGWKSFVLTDVIGYHDRSAAGPRDSSNWSVWNNRKNKSYFVNYHSYKNHLFTLIKNEYWQNYLTDWPWIESYEWKKLLYLVFFERQTLTSLKEFCIRVPSMWRKRKQIVAKRTATATSLRRWWK